MKLSLRYPKQFTLRLMSKLALGVMVLIPLNLQASPCPINYETFEEEVPHFDLELCPNNIPDADTGFCRLSLNAHEATIYVFKYAKDSACLADIRRVSIEPFLLK